MVEKKLISIPRVESRAPNKNTIEWEIPERVSVSWMLIHRIGFTFIAKVKVNKKHWWSSSNKIFTISNPNPHVVIMKGSEFLEEHGYYIDPNTISQGEIIGWGKKQQVKEPEVEEALNILDEATDKFKSGFSLVREPIENMLNSDVKQFLDVVRKGRTVRKFIYSTIANISGDMVESGHYHIYRGVLNPMGEGLLKIFDVATDELVNMGDMDMANAEEQKKIIRVNIKNVG